MWECNGCSKRFHTEWEKHDHMDDNDHWDPDYFCPVCDRPFASLGAVEQHQEAVNHWKFECETCTRTFKYSNDCNEHMRAHSHFKNCCQDCDRNFVNENALKMHLNSRIHQGANSKCPFCKVGFTTYSGVSNHLETGSCANAPQVNRSNIYEWVKSRDTGHAITTKQIGWHSEVDDAIYEANSRSWNGSAYECYLCHRKFDKLSSLSQHLSSPAHKSNLYRCPNRPGCTAQFKTLAGLFGHLESESCGFMRFDQVQSAGTKVFHKKSIAFY